jgi:hypothetical protein
MIKSDTLPSAPKETPPNGTPGPAGRAVPDTTTAVGNTAQSRSNAGDGTTQSSDWLAEASFNGPGTTSDGAKGPPMRSGTGGADREGHTEESHRGQY